MVETYNNLCIYLSLRFRILWNMFQHHQDITTGLNMSSFLLMWIFDVILTCITWNNERNLQQCMYIHILYIWYVLKYVSISQSHYKWLNMLVPTEVNLATFSYIYLSNYSEGLGSMELHSFLTYLLLCVCFELLQDSAHFLVVLTFVLPQVCILTTSIT